MQSHQGAIEIVADKERHRASFAADTLEVRCFQGGAVSLSCIPKEQYGETLILGGVRRHSLFLPEALVHLAHLPSASSDLPPPVECGGRTISSQSHGTYRAFV